jgi:hypothetical protein
MFGVIPLFTRQGPSLLAAAANPKDSMVDEALYSGKTPSQEDNLDVSSLNALSAQHTTVLMSSELNLELSPSADMPVLLWVVVHSTFQLCGLCAIRLCMGRKVDQMPGRDADRRSIFGEAMPSSQGIR